MLKNLQFRILSSHPRDSINDVNQRLKTYQNASNRLVINAQKAYYIKKILIENRSNPKKIWQTINFQHIFQKLKDQVEIAKLQTPNGMFTSPIVFAETPNEFFMNIGPQRENIQDVEADATTTVNLELHTSKASFFLQQPY